VTGRVVLFGATGYTGELTARVLAGRGVRPILAGRSAGRLARLADTLGGLDHAVADVERPASVRDLVTRGDVLVSTVGPFARWGAPAVEAAVAAGAHYLDSTGEPAFIRRVFADWGPRAAQAGCALLTAMGYDYVPGNLAAALALRDAGPGAVRVDVGYGGLGAAATSGGTRASLVGALLEPGTVLRGGELVPEAGGRRSRAFTAAGKTFTAITVGGSEPFGLRALEPALQDVHVYLGVPRRLAGPARLGSVPLGLALSVPGARPLLDAAAARLVRGSSGGPDAAARAASRSLVVAEVFDAGGRLLSRAVLDGTGPYDLTAELLARCAEQALAGAVRGTGALGPVEAFGLDELAATAADAGLTRVE